MDGLDLSFGLTEAQGSTRVEAAWEDYCETIGVPKAQVRDPAVAAETIITASSLPPMARVTIRTFRFIAENIGVEADADRMVPFLDDVMRRLPLDAVRPIMAEGGNSDRRIVVQGLVPVLSPAGVLRLGEAAALAYGKSVSPVLHRLLQKLRKEAEEAPGELRLRADLAFRSLVVQLVEIWSDEMISASTEDEAEEVVGQARHNRKRVRPEPVRVLQLSLESGAVGSLVWSAVAEQTATEEGARLLLDLVKNAPEGSRSAALITDRISGGERLRRLLNEEPIDWSLVDAVIERVGLESARPMLEILIEAKVRATRRAIMDRLVPLGPQIDTYVLERLDDTRWYVIRNMLALLRETHASVEEVRIRRFLSHEDARVRREALMLQLENPNTRSAAMAQALSDSDRHVLRSALQAARSNLPDNAVPILIRRLKDASLPSEFRGTAFQLLAKTRSEAAMETLLSYVDGGRTMFLRRQKLAPKTPDMLAALSALARSRAVHKRALSVLAAARRSRDPQVMEAIGPTGGAA